MRALNGRAGAGTVWKKSVLPHAVVLRWTPEKLPAPLPSARSVGPVLGTHSLPCAVPCPGLCGLLPPPACSLRVAEDGKGLPVRDGVTPALVLGILGGRL